MHYFRRKITWAYIVKKVWPCQITLSRSHGRTPNSHLKNGKQCPRTIFDLVTLTLWPWHLTMSSERRLKMRNPSFLWCILPFLASLFLGSANRPFRLCVLTSRISGRGNRISPVWIQRAPHESMYSSILFYLTLHCLRLHDWVPSTGYVEVLWLCLIPWNVIYCSCHSLLIIS